MDIFSEKMLAEIKEEIRPPFKCRVKDVLRPLYGNIRRRIGKNAIKKHFNIPKELNCTDIFLEPGYYSEANLIKIADRYHRIKDKTIIVTGCGYGKHLYTIADKFSPKVMYCMDPYPRATWAQVKELIESRTGVIIEFHNGTLQQVSRKLGINSIDIIISDAVLEHIKEMDSFLKAAHSVLKKNGGFYAGFGPLWFSPGGDHHNWGVNREYDHIMLNPEQYDNRWKEFEKNNPGKDEETFLYKHGLFNYLRPQEYVNYFRKYFVINELWLSIHRKALQMAVRNDSLYKKLSERYGKLDISIKAMHVFMRRI